MLFISTPICMADRKIYDCIIIGAGPRGLQAAIYLGRFNREVLLLDRGGGRTYHARHIRNFLTRKSISGKEIIETGMEQAREFNARIERAKVTKVSKEEVFEVDVQDRRYLSKFVIVSSGGYDNLPPVENVYKFLGTSFFTCVDCDGYETVGKKLLVLGNSIHTVRLAFAMKELYTKDVTLVLYFYNPPQDYRELLKEEGIPLIKGRPGRIDGEEKMEALAMQDGRRIPCEVRPGMRDCRSRPMPAGWQCSCS